MSIKSSINTLFKGKSKAQARPRNFFDGAKVDRFTQDWVTSNSTMDALLEHSLLKLRSRSRSLCENDGYAASFLRELESNVLGEHGFKLKMRCLQKGKKTVDKSASDQIETAWKEFGKAENFTTNKRQTRRAFHGIYLSSVARDGGALCQKVQGWPDNKFRFAVRGIEIDHLDPNYHNIEKGVKMSVERNQWGQDINFHLLNNHPGDQIGVWGEKAVNGLREVYSAKTMLHTYVETRFGQSQGKPWLTPVIPRMRQLHGYEEAEVIAARIQASKQGFFEETDEGGYAGEGKDELGNIKMDGSPGTWERLPTGVKAHLIDPTHPNGNYPSFRKGILRGVAAGIFVNYNVWAQDLDGVNYSSIRSGQISERDMWKIVQRWYIDFVEAPIFNDWLEMALMTNELPNYSILDYERLCRPEFNGRRWTWVDPDKESKAQERLLKNRLTSHQRISREQGLDHDEVLMEVEEDEKNAQDKGIDLFLDLVPESALEVEVDKTDN